VLTFVETRLFTSLVHQYLSDDEYAVLQQALADNPDAGDVIRGSGGVITRILIDAGRIVPLFIALLIFAGLFRLIPATRQRLRDTWPGVLVAAIGYGMDMFDCVIPTRFARSGVAFTTRGRIRLTNRRYRRDGYPIDVSCGCMACAGGFARAYLHHLFAANEILSAILVSAHNVHFYESLVAQARAAILADHYEEWRRDFLAQYQREVATD